MGKVVVRYKVKPERVEENERLIGRVYEELAESAPEGLRYATFRLDDGVSFVHIASIDTADGSNPLRGDRGLRRVRPRHRRALRRAAGRAGLASSSVRTASSRRSREAVTRAAVLCPVLVVVALAGLAAGGSAAGWESHSRCRNRAVRLRRVGRAASSSSPAGSSPTGTIRHAPTPTGRQATAGAAWPTCPPRSTTLPARARTGGCT